MAFPRACTASVVAAVLAGSLRGVPVAHADETPACLAAYEAAQKDRIAGRLVDAQISLRQCTASGCPTIVRRDCSEWLREVESALPTVIVSARTRRGADLAEVRVFFDDKLLAERLTGSPIAVDPGEHRIRYEYQGSAPQVDRIIVNAGEKNRLLQVVFDVREPSVPARAESRPVPIPPLILGGAGLLALGIGIFLDASASGEFSDLEEQCAPRCNEADVDSTRTKMLVGDVTLTAGIVLVGVSAVLFLVGQSGSPSSGSRAPTARIHPLGGTF